MTIKKRTLTLLKVWGMVVVFAVTVSLWGYIYFKTPFFTIKAYEFQGVPDFYSQKMAERFQSLTKETRYKVFPQNRVIGYPSSQMRLAVADILPNVAAIVIFPTGLHTLRISVSTYTPLFKIDETRAITKDGIIYTELKDMSLLPIFFIASSTTRDIVRKGVHAVQVEDLNENDFTNLSALIRKINQTIFAVTKIYIDSYGDVTIYSKNDKSKIIFSDKTDIGKVWSNLVSAIDTEPLKSKLSDQKSSLDYLDVRFGNKVFYKFTNASSDTIIKNHVATTTPEAIPIR